MLICYLYFVKNKIMVIGKKGSEIDRSMFPNEADMPFFLDLEVYTSRAIVWLRFSS